MSAKVLLFHMALDKKIRIIRLCSRLRIEPVVIEKSRYCQQLGTLAGITGFREKKEIFSGEELSGEMMVFSGMDRKQLDVFLAEYKKAEIAPVPLKAILTPHNIRWTPAELFRELLREHRSM